MHILFRHKFPNERIPHLQEVIDLCLNLGLQMFIDVKAATQAGKVSHLFTRQVHLQVKVCIRARRPIRLNSGFCSVKQLGILLLPTGGAVVFQSEDWWSEPGLCHHVVSLDKKLYSTLSLFTQVCKWVPAIIMLGVNLVMD